MRNIIRCLVAGFAMTVSVANAETYSIEGASPASLTGIVAQSLAQYADREGVTLQAVLGQTSTKTALKIAAGKTDVGVVPPLAYKAMVKGVGPYKNLGAKAGELSKNMRALFGFPGGTFHAVTWADSGITKMSDLKGKRVYVGPPAGAAHNMIVGMIDLAAGGLTPEEYTGIRAPWASGQQSFQDNQFDVFIPAVAVGSQSLNELSLQRPIRIIGVDPEITKTKEWQSYENRLGMDAVTIPAGTYGGQVNGDQDLTTASTVMMMAAGKDLPEDVAYRLTKAYWENLPAMKAGNALMRTIDETQHFLGVVAPLHPGAVRFYKERGVEVPENLIAQ